MSRPVPKRKEQSDSTSSSDSSEEERPPPKKKATSSGQSWQFGLLASMKDPSLKVFEDDRVVVIKDKYPKARHHFLVMPKDKINDLSHLKADHIGLLEHMKEVGKNIAAEHGDPNSYRHGFHARASMSHLHMHTISQDFDSPALKTKKHWNSFTTAFFMDVDPILEDLKMNEKITVPSSTMCDKLLKQSLKCHKCEKEFSTIPKLKEHLKTHDKKTG